ncbi:hypothetical protein [Erwinia aphidicola]|uniref:hypothetical protein n=2 Tax=Erwinia aphidicola TaxID=68334 RepID=UPI0030CCBB34
MDRVFNNAYFGRIHPVFLPLIGVIFLIQNTLWGFMPVKQATFFEQNQFTDRTRVVREGGFLGFKLNGRFLTRIARLMPKNGLSWHINLQQKGPSA